MLKSYRKVGSKGNCDIYEYKDSKGSKYYGAMERGLDNPKVPINMSQRGFNHGLKSRKEDC